MATTKSSVPLLYKPAGSPTSANAGKATIATSSDTKAVDILDPSGNVISGTRKDTVPHTPEPGAIPGPYNQNWWGPSANDIPAGSVIRVTNADGSYSYASIKNPYQGLRGAIDSGEGDSIKNAAILPANTHAEGSGFPSQFTPGQAGQYGIIPSYVGGMFPTASLAKFNSIQSAPYNFTDPTKFAEAFGQFNRGEIQKNFDLSKDLALKELSTELSSLQNFVPAAAALKRNEVSIDNQFNQAQRTQQVNQTLPFAQGDLNAQRQRANSYASGNIPDATQNSAYELGIRSASADRSAAGGFGASSSVARKASDLMSASERIQLSKYGDQLLSSNIQQQAGLFLAPTEYSNAGGQVNVMPSLSSSQLINSNLNAINGLATIPANQALQNETEQNQFVTGQEQATRQFNALGQYQASQFNAQQQNQFGLDLFGYNAGYANSVASGFNQNQNIQLELQQQQQQLQMMMQLMQQTQNSGLLGTGGNILGGLLNTGLGSVTGKGGGKGGGGSLPGAGISSEFPGFGADSGTGIGSGISG